MSPLRPIALRALAAQSDDRLVQLIREGHEPAFEEVVRRYRAPLVAFATAIAKIDRAEDVVQVSLQRAQRALMRDDAEIRLRPWLFAIVRNDSLNMLRDEPRFAEIDPDYGWVPGPEEVVQQRQEFGALMNAICALPAAQREALVQREMEGRGHAEIAAQLGTSATAVRGLIFRARTTLRNAVGAFVPLPLMRSLLGDVRVAEATATAGAGAGGLALIGGGTKIGAVVATAVIAVGAGTAIRGEQSVDTGSSSSESKEDGEGAGEARRLGSAAAPLAVANPAGGAVPANRSRESGETGQGGNAGGDSDSAGAHGGGEGDNSGPGGGSGDGDGENAEAVEDAVGEVEEATEDEANDLGDGDRSGSGSGSGSGGRDSAEPDDSSGPGSGPDAEPEPLEPDDSSGPGSGSDSLDPDDSSGDGSGLNPLEPDGG